MATKCTLTKEPTQWRSGWWDYYTLHERPRRPLEWSSSSVIFTPHPIQPLITARHFSSFKQFVIPSPQPIMSSPGSYKPPSMISISPRDDWLFAYFPRKDQDLDGIGCMWMRGSHIDIWNVREFWSFLPRKGAISACWLGPAREWITDTLGNSTRLPPRGPPTPISFPTLVIVMQDNYVQICYIQYYANSLKFVSTPLQPTFFAAGNQYQEPTNSQGTKCCIDATIGLGYNDSSIFVATRSRNIPNSDSKSPLSSSNGTGPSTTWNFGGEEYIVDVYELQILFDGVHYNLLSRSLPPLGCPGNDMTSFTFVCTPLAVSHAPPSNPEISPSNKSGEVFLAISYLEFGDYTSTPTSCLKLYSIRRCLETFSPSQSPHESSKPSSYSWIARLESTRSFSTEVLAFSKAFIKDTCGEVLLVGLVSTSGSLKGAKPAREVQIGTMNILNIPDLEDCDSWEATPIKCLRHNVGREHPLYATVSPNRVLACTLSSSIWPVRTAVHNLPSPKKAIFSSGQDASLYPLSSFLVSAILNRRSAVDVYHSLSAPATPLAAVYNTLFNSLSILDKHNNGLLYSSIWDILGISIDIYRTRVREEKDCNEKELLGARWQAAHSICSLAACNLAFEGCLNGNEYDLGAVWQLNGLCTWLIGFIERLMKECISYSGYSLTHSKTGESHHETVTDALSDSIYPPMLLNLVHPYPLQNLLTALKHIERYREYIGSLTAIGENALIAREILIDVVDCSGIDLAGLDLLLEKAVQKSAILDSDDCRKAIAACQPTFAMQASLHETLQELINSKILDKASLFIKPNDLMDGVARMTLAAAVQVKDMDIVTKAILIRQGAGSSCLRCGGQSEIEYDHPISLGPSIQWRAWEKIWTLRCICGGLWTSPKIN